MKLIVRMRYHDEQGEIQVREQESAVDPKDGEHIRVDDRDLQVCGRTICYETVETNVCYEVAGYVVPQTCPVTVVEVFLR